MIAPIAITSFFLIVLFGVLFYKGYAYYNNVEEPPPLLSNLLSFQQDDNIGKEYSLI